SLYRTVMRVFMDSKERFVTRLRPQDLAQPLDQLATRAEIDAALARLCEWGNLHASLDVTDVRTAAEFYGPRQLFEITVDGEAAERALAMFETSANSTKQLQDSPLADICDAVQELRNGACAQARDARNIHRNLLLLRASFEEFQAAAESLAQRLDSRSG